MTELFQVFYTSDMGYLMPTYVSICSLFHHASVLDEVVVHILDCGIKDDAWDRFAAGIKRLFPTSNDIVRNKVDMTRFACCNPYGGSRATYARILPAELTDADWCLFTDGDVLFVDDVLKMRTFYDDTKLVVGHNDYDENYFFESWSQGKERWYRENDIAWDPLQFACMGFVLMNLKLMRERHFIESCFKAFARFTKSPTADQEAINSVCKGRIGYLPDGWGKFNLCLGNPGFIPSAIHYTYSKPWKVGCRWMHAISDADRLWLIYAKKVAKLQWRQYAFAGRCKYLKLRIIEELYRLRYSILPGSRDPMSRDFVLKRMFACRCNWKKLGQEVN